MVCGCACRRMGWARGVAAWVSVSEQGVARWVLVSGVWWLSFFGLQALDSGTARFWQQAMCMASRRRPRSKGTPHETSGARSSSQVAAGRGRGGMPPPPRKAANVCGLCNRTAKDCPHLRIDNELQRIRAVVPRRSYPPLPPQSPPLLRATPPGHRTLATSEYES
jgi:hypothetical protein